jgi:hypothetical protein
MNPKQKKLIWIAGIVVIVFYFAPSVLNSIRYAALIRAQNEARMAKPPAAKSASPLPGSPVAPASAGTVPGAAATSTASPQFDNLIGIWQGMALLPEHGNCNMKLELRNAPEPGQIKGFPVMVCVQIPVISTGPKTFAQYSPASAVITGKPTGNAVEFTVDKVVSKGEGHCAFTSFTVTPFGSDQIAAEWKQDTCPAGQILLRRIGK